MQHGRCDQRCAVLSFLDSFYFYLSAVLNWLLGSQGATGCEVRGWQTTVCCLRRLRVKTMLLSMTLICFRGSVCSLRQTKLQYSLVCMCVWVWVCRGGRRIVLHSAVTSSWHTRFHKQNQKFISVCSFWSFRSFLPFFLFLPSGPSGRFPSGLLVLSFWSFLLLPLDVILSSIIQI